MVGWCVALAASYDRYMFLAPPVRFELRETSIVKKIWSYVPTIR